jgi:phosphoglycerate dehydrogenase-like enzyme
MQKILINAEMHADAWRFLEERGYGCIYVPMSDPDGARRAVADCAGMVANAILPIDDAFLLLAPGLRVVGRMGVGYDNVDVEAAARRGVRVVNTPLPIIEPVAEHTVLLLLAVARKLAIGDRAVRDGRWREADTLPGPELAGKTLGLVGLGNTGQRVAEIAALGFGMRVVYFDRVARPAIEEKLGAERLALEALLGKSDFVSLHVNLSPETRRLIDRRALGLFKPGAVLINVARGAVVDEAALVEALRSGRLAGAGLDVFESEPPARDNPLFDLTNVVLTPHVAGASAESRLGCSMVVKDIVRVLEGDAPEHPVN